LTRLPSGLNHLRCGRRVRNRTNKEPDVEGLLKRIIKLETKVRNKKLGSHVRTVTIYAPHCTLVMFECQLKYLATRIFIFAPSAGNCECCWGAGRFSGFCDDSAKDRGIQTQTARDSISLREPWPPCVAQTSRCSSGLVAWFSVAIKYRLRCLSMRLLHGLYREFANETAL